MGPERILPARQFAFTSDPNGRASNDNTYAIGDEVLVQVTFSTDVTVTGSPRLELNVGGGAGKPASYSGVNGASRLLFSYTVVEGHEDTNGISINANKLTHNGATIVDAADSTKNAVLTHGVEPADPDHKVDGVRPVFQSATIFPADPDRIVSAWVQAIVRRAYQATDVKTATRLLTDLAKRLEDEYPSAAGSVRERLDETLTVLTLHLSTRLQRSLATTNAAESLLSRTRHVKRNVKRWRGGQMMLRWVAAGVLEAVKGFRRLKGCGDMPRLVSALRARDQRLGLGVSEVNVA